MKNPKRKTMSSILPYLIYNLHKRVKEDMNLPLHESAEIRYDESLAAFTD